MFILILEQGWLFEKELDLMLHLESSGVHPVVVTLCGISGSALHAFNLLQGATVHTKEFHHPQSGQLYSQMTLCENDGRRPRSEISVGLHVRG